MAQSLPNFDTICTHMWQTTPELILSIVWNGIKQSWMMPQGKITWKYWKTTDVSKQSRDPLLKQRNYMTIAF